jgi:hypothetical protein
VTERYIIWVTGGLKYEDSDKVIQELKKFPPGSIVIHGDAKGADTFADIAAEHLHMARVKVPYLGYAGRAGGPIRNRIIGRLAYAYAKTYNAKAVCLAFGGDRGTDGSVEIASDLDMEIREFDRA